MKPYTKLTADERRPYEYKASGLIYPDLRAAYSESMQMCQMLAKCLYNLEQLSKGETPEQATHKNIFEISESEVRKLMSFSPLSESVW